MNDMSEVEASSSIAAEIYDDSRRYCHNDVGAVLKFPGDRGEDCGGGENEERINTPAVSLCPCLCFRRRFRPSRNRP